MFVFGLLSQCWTFGVHLILSVFVVCFVVECKDEDPVNPEEAENPSEKAEGILYTMQLKQHYR